MPKVTELKSESRYLNTGSQVPESEFFITSYIASHKERIVSKSVNIFQASVKAVEGYDGMVPTLPEMEPQHRRICERTHLITVSVWAWGVVRGRQAKWLRARAWKSDRPGFETWCCYGLVL